MVNDIVVIKLTIRDRLIDHINTKDILIEALNSAIGLIILLLSKRGT
jgi:hypothetical protein